MPASSSSTNKQGASKRPATLRCTGDEDVTTRPRRRRALVCAARAGRDVVVELGGLAFADSSLMVDLAVVAGRLRTRGLKLHIRGAQPQVRRLIELVGLDHLPGVRVEGMAPA